MRSIYDFVKKQRNDFRTETVTIADGYEFSQYETLKTIDIYHNSKFTSGPEDSLGREKPFFNITKFRVNVATRATDLDIYVVPWRDLITDQVDVRKGVKMERHYYTPAELKTNAPKGWTNIDIAIVAAKKKQESQAANPDAKENVTPGDYIEVWESASLYLCARASLASMTRHLLAQSICTRDARRLSGEWTMT